MSYFSDNYAHLRYPVRIDGDPGAPGLRDAQRGALFAVGAHFTQRSDPAIVTMPTGSGKTAVLQACAYLLKAERVLILTPSRLVREQIAEDFSSLGVLKRIAVMPEDVAPPRVMATTSRVRSDANWAAMRDYDVVVATVQSVSPHLEEVPPPPANLFDLILVDEAHHSPALTWKTILEGFAGARRVLFTATPFRRDDREIKGRFVYSYDLKRAYDDGVFGHIDFRPVTVALDQAGQAAEDQAIARAAEAKLNEDRAANLAHLLMVRTDSRQRAKELEVVYAQNTGLRLQLITGDHSLPHVRRVLAKLGNGDLDGIICVNMLGEGFDMPRLKIAAIHAPHRSLAVTLQFIGRFARTVGDRLGNATFLASPTAIEVEAKQLYAAGAVWAEIIPNLSEARIRQEVAARETLESFATTSTVPDLADLSLYGLSPYAHVKIFRLINPLDLTNVPDFGSNREIVFSWVSEGERATVYITRQANIARWSSDDRLIDVRYDVFIFYYDESSKLLFICASKRADGLYRQIANSLVGYEPRILGLGQVNRALKELDDPRFFQVGMKNRQANSLTESYRILAGSHADEAIRTEDAKLYNRGHCFGSATENGNKITIGLSSASKIWSNATMSVPEMLDWCKSLARKIHDKKAAVTGSKLDLLLSGATVSEIPARILYAMWPIEIYLEPPLAIFRVAGQERTLPLTDFALEVEGSNTHAATLKVWIAGFETRILFRIAGEEALFAYLDDQQPNIDLDWQRERVDLVAYLNDNSPGFMLDDWSRLDGEEHYPVPDGGFELYDQNLVDVIDWKAAGVDVTVEYASGQALASSIQGYLSTALNSDAFDVVYWDHGAGETADFVTFKRRDDGGVDVQFYHCKGSTGAKPGNRVDDVYEVCGQAVKGTIWCDIGRLTKRLAGRIQRNRGMATFIKGTAAELASFASARPARFQMVIVQPGIAKGRIEQKLSEVLGAANAHLVASGHLEMRTIGSATG